MTDSNEKIKLYLSTITMTAGLVAILGFLFQLVHNHLQQKRDDREKGNDIERDDKNLDITRANTLMKDISNSMDDLFYQIRYEVFKERRDDNGTLTAYYIDSKDNNKLEEYYRAKEDWWKNWLYRLSASEVQFGNQVRAALEDVHDNFCWVCSKINQHETQQTIVDIDISSSSESTSLSNDDDLDDIIGKIRQKICDCNYIMMRQIQENQVGSSCPREKYVVPIVEIQWKASRGQTLYGDVPNVAWDTPV